MLSRNISLDIVLNNVQNKSKYMKSNQDSQVNIKTLQDLELKIKGLLDYPDFWDSLDVDYFPPRVERLYIKMWNYRVHLHLIHKTDSECLYHKHRWAAAFKQLYGSYEMGITYSENEITSEEAHSIPTLAKFTISPGNYYEMTQTDCMHYVRPITDKSLSIMLTKDLYPEASFRKETLDRKLNELTNERKMEILSMFKMLM
jgi:hypothetical protein